MPQYPVVKFVDAPTPAANVRYDFHDDISVAGIHTWPVSDGFTIGTPTLEGDPQGIGVTYGLRSLEFTQAVDGTKALALAKQSALAREILRANNWLLLQISDETEPVWFRTYRAQPGELSFEHYTAEGVKDHWRIGMRVPAEPFAYGARVTQPVVTVANDPAAVSNPLGFVMPTILGDAPAPLRLAAEFSGALDQHDILWAVSPVPDDYEPIVWQVGTGDGFTAGADTGAGTAGAAYSGGSARTVSFATDEDLVSRVFGAVSGPVPPGRYRAFVRVARTAADSAFTLRLAAYDPVFGADPTGADTVTLESSVDGTTGPTDATYVDLGVRSFPSNLSDMDLTGLNYTPSVALQVGRTAGAGSLRLDCMVLIPMELKGTDGASTSLVSEFVSFGPQAGDVMSVWDGDTEGYARMNGFGVVDSGVQPYNRGGFPVGLPGVTNALHLITQTRTGPGFFDTTDPDDVTDTTDVTVSYHPRLLWIGDH